MMGLVMPVAPFVPQTNLIARDIIWNSLDTGGNFTLSNSNHTSELTANLGSFTSIRVLGSCTNVKVYFEVQCTQTISGSLLIGIANNSQALNTFLGSSINSIAVQVDNGSGTARLNVNGSGTTIGANWITSPGPAWVKFAVDLTQRPMVIQGGPVGGSLVALTAPTSSSSSRAWWIGMSGFSVISKCTLNTAGPFLDTPPSGYIGYAYGT